MLSPEDLNVLGISDALFGDPLKNSVRCADNENVYHLFAATSRNQRERAYHLAYRVYERMGYVPPNPRRLCVSAYDVQHETITILAMDDGGRDVGTITLVFDSTAGLPSDEIYGTEINAMRRRGCRLVEAVRYCIDTEQVHSQVLMRRLLNVIFLYALRIGRCDYVVNECNPHHRVFYLRKLLFEQVGPERACPRVKGAPAVLMTLDLNLYRQQIQRVAGTKNSERTLYPLFYGETEEAAVAQFFAGQQAAMTCEDAFYFGLATATRAFQAVA